MTTVERKFLDITPEALTGPLGEALFAGKMRATLVSKVSSEHISLGFQCAWRERGDGQGNRGWRYDVSFDESSHVFISVPRSRDNVGQYMLTGSYPGHLFPAKDWDTGVITADPVRYWVAEKLLLIAAGRMPMEGTRYKVLVGTHCLRCGAELDEDESIAAGYGPHCREVVSKTYGTRHQRRESWNASSPASSGSSGSQSVASSVPKTGSPTGSGQSSNADAFVLQPGESLDDVYARLAKS